MSSFRPREPIVKACDLVVCGGGAGLITAVKAAQMGKKVILLEKARIVGGDMNLAHAFFPVYSKVHAEAWLADVREDAVRNLCAMTDGVVSEELMRLSRRSRRSIRIACHMIAILPAIRYNSKQRENTQPAQRRQYLWTRNILIWPS